MEKIGLHTIALILVLALSSCAPRVYQAATSTRDSISVQITERIVRDTVVISLPAEQIQIVTRDTASHLETSVAISDAKLVGGELVHELRNKVQEMRAPVVVTVRDTVTLRISEKAETIVQKVPAELTRWQSFLLVLGRIFGALLGAMVLYFIIRFIIKIRRSF